MKDLSKAISKHEWINRYGRAEIERDMLRVVPCHCTDDPACLGWKVEFPKPHEVQVINLLWHNMRGDPLTDRVDTLFGPKTRSGLVASLEGLFDEQFGPIKSAMRKVVDYNWDDELHDYEVCEQDNGEGAREDHVFKHLVVLDNFLNDTKHTAESYLP